MLKFKVSYYSYLTKQGYGIREYCVDGFWTPNPDGPVRGFRYNLSEFLPKIREVAGLWRYIKETSIQTPEKPDKILEQLTEAGLMSKRLCLFSPWGPRYNRDSPRIEEKDPEVVTLKEIRSIFDRFNEAGLEIDFLLMPADTYGTEINGLDQNFVKDYFKFLGEQSRRELGEQITVKPWSEIRDVNKERYEELKRKVEETFDKKIKPEEFRRSIKTAAVFNPSRPEEAAKRYCTERLVEGNLISELFNPIKLSLVRKEKDVLDGPLKRIYIVKNRAPWLGGE